MQTGLLVVLAVLGAPVSVVALLVAWARWLRRRSGAFPSRIAYTLLGVGIGTATVGSPLYGVLRVALSPAAVGNAAPGDPSAKARLLAESISAAMNCGVFFFLGTLSLTALWLLFATWRWHWSVRQPPGNDAPPYR